MGRGINDEILVVNQITLYSVMIGLGEMKTILCTT